MIYRRRCAKTAGMSQHQVDTLIVGAGIAGLVLARELRRRGQSVIVAHDPAAHGASEAAVGLLNPVRGRRCTLAWRAGETFATAREVYQEIAHAAGGEPLFRDCDVVRAFANDDERAALERRRDAIQAAGFTVEPCPNLPSGLRATASGAVRIGGGASIDVLRVLTQLRAELREAQTLVEVRCDSLEFPGTAAVRWAGGGVTAQRIVLAGGAADLRATAFPSQPLRVVHGESLLVRADDLAGSAAFVCGHHLAPVARGLWSCGGTKVPGDSSGEITTSGREELERFLRERVEVPWKTVDHRAGVRATTLDTKPLVGNTGNDSRVWVFNGFGSQGYCLGPWLARALADHIVHGRALPPEVDPNRFSRPTCHRPAASWHAADLARELVLKQLVPGDLAIDLTVGNGGDTLWLAEALGADGAVLGIDIQNDAIEATTQRMAHTAVDAHVELRCADHAELARHVPADWRGRIGAVVANLGYLPGSGSRVTTRPETTIAAFSLALPMLRQGGLLAAVIGTRRANGTEELHALERWGAALDPSRWRIAWSRAPDGSSRTPVVLSVQRR